MFKSTRRQYEHGCRTNINIEMRRRRRCNNKREWRYTVSHYEHVPTERQTNALQIYYNRKLIVDINPKCWNCCSKPNTAPELTIQSLRNHHEHTVGNILWRQTKSHVFNRLRLSSHQNSPRWQRSACSDRERGKNPLSSAKEWSLHSTQSCAYRKNLCRSCFLQQLLVFRDLGCRPFWSVFRETTNESSSSQKREAMSRVESILPWVALARRKKRKQSVS